MGLLFIVIIVLIIVIYNNKQKAKKELEKSRYQSIEISRRYKQLSAEFEQYKAQTEPLKKYQPIVDVEAEVVRIQEEGEQLKKEARADAKLIRERAQVSLDQAQKIAAKVEADALKKAEDIAGEAWEAKQNADQWEETVKAMKNIIQGYGDEYLIPGESLLDELADEYDHKVAGQELKEARTLIDSMIKNREAADCDYVEEHRKKTAIEFVLDAFNGKVDSIMSTVKSDNYGVLLQKLNDAYRLVNHNGRPFRNARILPRYFEVIVDQLKLAVTVQELKLKDREEQKQIREAMREEERARREYEKAIKQAEKEERLLEQARKEIEDKLLKAAEEERAQFEAQLEAIKLKLVEAEERSERAISMAQQTRRGHVYIISNVGSFGEEVFKIGMTRRLEPLDRVKELGDASVPFSFDVHAMIHSEDAPQLEKELHEAFNQQRVNKVNTRKEFFEVSLADIKAKIETLGLETHWTMKAEALEYRESVQIAKRTIVKSA